MRILITGITGFVGGHLTEALHTEGGHALFGVSRAAGDRPPDGVEAVYAAELADTAAVADVVRRVRPDWVFHLAGYANTHKSFDEPGRCWADNLDATRSLFDAVASTDVRPRVVLASTGLIYGDPDPARQDCDESTPLRPASPYAASKAAADLLGYQVTRRPGLDVVRVRLFNQIGPRQQPGYAIPDWASQVARIEAGRQPPVLTTGVLSAYRDLTDVRDMVRALRLVAEKGTGGEAYNAGRGDAWQMRDVVHRLLGLAKVPVALREPAAAGPAAAASRADTRKLRAATGWEPTIPLDQTLADVLDYWRGQLVADR